MKLVLAILFVGITTLMLTAEVNAAGGKERADLADGPAYQLGETPFPG